MNGEAEFAMWITVGAASVAFWLAMTPLIRAVAQRISGKVSSDQLTELHRRIDALEHRGLTSGEVEAQYDRLAEVEERLDFAERMLAARTSGPGTLHPGETT